MILASKSPRRQQLLHMIQKDFAVVPSHFDETLVSEDTPDQLVRVLASKKAQCVFHQYPNDVVVGSDTVVVSPEGEVFGIPVDRTDAIRMLRSLSGRIHSVYTGVAIYTKKTQVLFHRKAQVEFVSISNDMLHWYLGTGEPFDKAGAYGIQTAGALLVRRIIGDYYTVVGLPIRPLHRILQKLKWPMSNHSYLPEYQ